VTADRAGLRDEIAAALAGYSWRSDILADVVMAVVGPRLDRAEAVRPILAATSGRSSPVACAYPDGDTDCDPVLCPPECFA
jgi:hypothetical protein